MSFYYCDFLCVVTSFFEYFSSIFRVFVHGDSFFETSFLKNVVMGTKIPDRGLANNARPAQIIQDLLTPKLFKNPNCSRGSSVVRPVKVGYIHLSIQTSKPQPFSLSLTHSLTHPPNHSLIHSPTHPITHSSTQSLTHPATHRFIFVLWTQFFLNHIYECLQKPWLGDNTSAQV